MNMLERKDCEMESKFSHFYSDFSELFPCEIQDYDSAEFRLICLKENVENFRNNFYDFTEIHPWTNDKIIELHGIADFAGEDIFSMLAKEGYCFCGEMKPNGLLGPRKFCAVDGKYLAVPFNIESGSLTVDFRFGSIYESSLRDVTEFYEMVKKLEIVFDSGLLILHTFLCHSH